MADHKTATELLFVIIAALVFWIVICLPIGGIVTDAVYQDCYPHPKKTFLSYARDVLTAWVGTTVGRDIGTYGGFCTNG